MSTPGAPPRALRRRLGLVVHVPLLACACSGTPGLQLRGVRLPDPTSSTCAISSRAVDSGGVLDLGDEARDAAGPSGGYRVGFDALSSSSAFDVIVTDVEVALTPPAGGFSSTSGLPTSLDAPASWPVDEGSSTGAIGDLLRADVVDALAHDSIVLQGLSQSERTTLQILVRVRGSIVDRGQRVGEVNSNALAVHLGLCSGCLVPACPDGTLDDTCDPGQDVALTCSTTP